MDKLHFLAKSIKAVIVGLGAWLSAKFGILLPVMGLLFLVMALDFYTGWNAAIANGESITSRIGWQGFRKKTLYLAGVACGLVVDYLILAVADAAGLGVAFIPIFGLLAAVWLILNELLSILENIARAGVAMPPFLMKIVTFLKIKVEEKGEPE